MEENTHYTDIVAMIHQEESSRLAVSRTPPSGGSGETHTFLQNIFFQKFLSYTMTIRIQKFLRRKISNTYHTDISSLSTYTYQQHTHTNNTMAENQHRRHQGGSHGERKAISIEIAQRAVIGAKQIPKTQSTKQKQSETEQHPRKKEKRGSNSFINQERKADEGGGENSNQGGESFTNQPTTTHHQTSCHHQILPTANIFYRRRPPRWEKDQGRKKRSKRRRRNLKPEAEAAASYTRKKNQPPPHATKPPDENTFA